MVVLPKREQYKRTIIVSLVLVVLGVVLLNVDRVPQGIAIFAIISGIVTGIASAILLLRSPRDR